VKLETYFSFEFGSGEFKSIFFFLCYGEICDNSLLSSVIRSISPLLFLSRFSTATDIGLVNNLAAPLTN